MVDINEFGRINGVEVTNKDSTMKDIDELAGPADVEYFFFRPVIYVKIPFTKYGISWNNFGHSAIGYRKPDGQKVIMNMGKKAGRPNVSFYDPAQFLWGAKETDCTEQFGQYSRDMITIRIKNVPLENRRKLDEFYTNLQKGTEDQRFSLFAPILNFIGRFFPSMPRYGNCASWTSMGLKEAGIVSTHHNWPKQIWIDMYENYDKIIIGERDNMSVVNYKRIPHAHHVYGLNGDCLDIVAPLQELRSLAYINMPGFAEVVVEVPEGSTDAVVRRNPNPYQPSPYRNAFNGPVAFAISVWLNVMAFRYGRRKWINFRNRHKN